MKRSALPRTTPLRADPSAVLAFQRRSRKALARGNGLKRRPTAERQPERARVKFKAKRPARAQLCACGCGARAAHWHHWLEQEHIRVYVRGLRLEEAAHDRLLRRLLRDERNLSPYTADCHLGTEQGQTRFRAEDVPPSAHEFAAELGPEWAERLRRAYPAAGSSGTDSQEVPHGG